MKSWVIFIISVITIIVLFLSFKWLNKPSTKPDDRVISGAIPTSSDSFARADAPWNWSFPKDHGPHPEFQTEWWYYTGNLTSETGDRFGYQLTFFRRALLPQDFIESRDSPWGVNQVYMVHFAVSEIESEQFHAYERLSRGAAGLSGAQADPFQVWVEDILAKEIAPGVYSLSASHDGIQIDLLLTDSKGPILHGDQGLSQKGPESGQASYYYSLTRLETTGKVRIRDRIYDVQGLSWMDHEFSTSALAPDQIGWDWFSLQLDDGSELMVFQIRKEDGSIDPFSSGTYIRQDGTTFHLNQEDFIIQVLDTWKSPNSQAVYPSHWKLSVPKIGLELEIFPQLADQELNVSYAYWEGAVRTSGMIQDKDIIGNGYIEMTGYSQSMSGEF